MANMHLVTGFAGMEHVTAADVGAFNVELFGSGQFVFDKGNCLEASIITNNIVRVFDGDIYMQGRHIRLNEDTYVDLAIENGEQGYLRNDLIVARYTMDSMTGVEECNLVVIKGTPVTASPADPAYTSGDLIVEHAMLNDMPLYRVAINGVSITGLTPLFSTFGENIHDVIDMIEAAGTAIDAVEASVAAITPAKIGAQATITGGATTITSSNLTANRALISNGSGKVAVSGVTSTQLGYLSGVTSAIQTQLNSKGVGNVEFKSWTGTGTYGASNPNSLTFSFAPKLVWVYKNITTANDSKPGMTNMQSYFFMFITDNWPTTYTYRYGFTPEMSNGTQSYTDASYGKRSSDGKTLSWYNTRSKSEQYNSDGWTYKAIAWG